jgi:hypothetical protein
MYSKSDSAKFGSAGLTYSRTISLSISTVVGCGVWVHLPEFTVSSVLSQSIVSKSKSEVEPIDYTTLVYIVARLYSRRIDN